MLKSICGLYRNAPYFKPFAVRNPEIFRKVSCAPVSYRYHHEENVPQNVPRESLVNENIIREGEVTYIPKSRSCIFHTDYEIFRRHANVSVLRSLVNLEKSFSKRLNRPGNKISPLEKWDRVNTHITGKKIKSILSMCDSEENGLALARYAIEIPDITEIVSVVQNIDDNLYKNMEINECKDKMHFIQCQGGRATRENLQLNCHKHYYDAVIMDVKENATKFFHPALNCVANGGVLCLNYPLFNYKAFGTTMFTVYNPEMALRFSLRMLQLSAQKNGIKVLPLLCYNYNKVMQLFVQIFHSTESFSCSFPEDSGRVYHCPRCSSFFSNKQLQPNIKCKECGTSMQVSDILWMSPYFDKKFPFTIRKDVNRHYGKSSVGQKMKLMLAHLEQEVPEALFYHNVTYLMKMFCLERPLPIHTFVSALENMGYQSSLTHMDQRGLKTLASMEVVWDIVRSWENIFPEKYKLSLSDIAQKIIRKKPERKVDFYVRLDVQKRLRSLDEKTKIH